MGKMIAIRKVVLGEHHSRPGRTIHTFSGKEFAPFTSLAICQCPGEGGFYMMHICENGQVADTWHENLGDAFHQAEYEFGVRSEEWIETSEIYQLSEFGSCTAIYFSNH
jgi:hypothetical protein